MTAWVVQILLYPGSGGARSLFSEMNLYRSFGNLMEAWLTEGNISCPEWRGNNAEGSHTPLPENLRSESVDSGVETASCDMSSPAASTDMDLFTPRLTPASTSQSPLVLSPVPSSSSSSSPHLCLSRAEKSLATAATALHSKLEQALQRTESKQLKDNPKPPTVEEVLSRRPRASFQPKRHTSELLRGQRSGSLGLRKTVNTSVPVRQMSDVCRRPLSSLCYDKPRSEEGRELSPGLNYLEQVCQMLEEVARQRMHSQALQPEMDALSEDRDTQATDTCQRNSTAAEEDDVASCQRLEEAETREQSSSEPQRKRDLPYGHFRQRSASDTTLALLHLRRLKADCRGQHMSTDDLLEEEEEDHENQESTKKERSKTNKIWRLKIGSLRREESAASDTKGQQMQPSEKNSARRRLSQLFRRRRKTLPV